MARPLRIELKGGFHHVVTHGNGRLWLFRNDHQYKHCLDLLGNVSTKYKVIVHTFVLMTNHMHLLIETPQPNLNQFMRKLLSDYASYYNHWYQRSGSVFKSRYGSFLIQYDGYYEAVVRYICRNPVRARIVIHPEQYRWSSLYYLLHKDIAKRELNWYQTGTMIKRIGGRNLLNELLAGEDADLPVIYRKFIGDRIWADEIIKENHERLTDEISRAKEMKIGITDPLLIVGIVADVFGVNKEKLITGADISARNWSIHILHKYTPLDGRRIGEIFNMNKWTVLKTVQRMANKEKTPHDEKTLRLITSKITDMSNVQT